jgi:hypothetical protein
VKLSTVALAVYTVRHCAATGDGYEVGAAFSGVIGKEADSESSAEEVFAALLAADGKSIA